MNNPLKYFFIVTLIFIFCIIGYRYYDYVYKQNFILSVSVTCDPAIHSCFVWDCGEEEGCDATPYEKIEILAYQAPQCLEEHNCESFSCTGLESCTVTYCSEDTLSEGEKCLEVNTNSETNVF
jgi:hypothetical protein